MGKEYRMSSVESNTFGRRDGDLRITAAARDLSPAAGKL